MNRHAKFSMVIVTLGIVLLMSPPLFGGDSDDDASKTALKVALAQNEVLKSALAAKMKDIESLQAKVAALTKVIEKAGIDIGSGDAPGGAGTATPTTQPAKDANTTACSAFYKFVGAVAAIAKSGKTNIQMRTAWLAAAKELDSAIKNTRVTITYTLCDVNVETDGKTVQLRVWSPTIKSSDPNVADLTLYGSPEIRIISTHDAAMKITRGSKLTVEGGIVTNINFSTPPSGHPSFFLDGLFADFSKTSMKGFLTAGTVTAKEWTINSSGIPEYADFLWTRPRIMIQDNCVTKIDGTTRVRRPDAETHNIPKKNYH